MAVTQIADVVVPEEFTAYIVQNSVEKSALVQSSIVARNSAIDDQLKAGADAFSIPFWKDPPDDPANIANDDPAVMAVPRKLGSGNPLVTGSTPVRLTRNSAKAVKSPLSTR